MLNPEQTLRERVAALSPSQRGALAREIDTLAATPAALVSPPKRLVVYWQAASTNGAAAATEGELKKFLADRLPGYMIPGAFCELSEIPKTASGKLDRRRLPIPGTERSRSDPEGEVLERALGLSDGAPRNDSERILCDVWQEVLGLDYVSIHDDFFEVGGDSLLSIRVLSRARRQGVAIEPEAFFANPTIAGLTEHLEREATPTDEAATDTKADTQAPGPDAVASGPRSLDTDLSGLDAADLESVGALLAEIDDD